MRSLGAGDWITYGWGDDLTDREKSHQDRLHIHFTEQVEVPVTQAAIGAVRDIQLHYPAPYTLMCSGGIDSQAMIWAWVLSGVPFEIVAIKYMSDSTWFNDYDLVQLDEFCGNHGLTVNYKEFDLIDFLENGLHAVATTYDCDSPQICTYIKMTEMIPQGTILFSGNYILHNKTIISYTLLGLHRYAIATNDADRCIIPFFLLHNPALARAFKFVRNVIGTSPYYGGYLEAGFPVIPQQAKFNGFEGIKEYYDKYLYRVDIATRLKFSARPSARAFDLLFRYPYYTGNLNCGRELPPIFKG